MRPQIHYKLNPDLWEPNDVLKPEIREKLLEIAATFYTTIKIDQEPEDITLTGSSANYNYTSSSDIDLHILVPFSKVKCEEELTRDYVLAKKSLWNNEHDIKIFNREVEVYIQNTEETHTSTGVYSILDDKWILHPVLIDEESINVDEELFHKKFKEYQDLILHNIQKNTNLEFLNKIKKKISQDRKEGLIKDGEFGVDNLVFKKLRNEGLLDKLSQHLISIQDKKLSVENFISFVSKKK